MKESLRQQDYHKVFQKRGDCIRLLAQTSGVWGVLEVESHNQLSEREIEAVKEYWEGQESDGWGEGFEQRGIKIPEGELYVSFWNSGDEFFLTTEEGLKGEEQEPAVQKGGIVFGAL